MLRLRKLEKKDLEIRVSWMNDPRVYQYMNYSLPITLESTLKWFDQNKSKNNRWDFVLECKDTHKILAMTGFTDFNSDLNTVESYTFVNPEVKSQGFGKKSMFAKILYAFKVIGLSEICSYIDEENIASRKMVKSVGFKEQGIVSKKNLKENTVLNKHYYKCTDRDFNFDLYPYYIEGKAIILL